MRGKLNYRNKEIWHRNQVYDRNNNKKKLLIFYISLLFLTCMIVSNSLNKLELKMVINELGNSGIHYDEFRDFRVGAGQMKYLQKRLKKEELLKKKEPLNRNSSYDQIHYFTMEMILNDYNLLHNRRNKKKNLEYLIDYFKEDESYKELYGYYNAILRDIKCFPTEQVTFSDTWNAQRSYGGTRRHEGTDLMPFENKRGVYPVYSMTDGIVEKIGWLDQGGYRIGVRSKEGGYFYYAHLDSYAPDMKEGASVRVGDLLGYMGDSGYGEEGTKGEFLVHLHLGIYVEAPFGELSINPYWILKSFE